MSEPRKLLPYLPRAEGEKFAQELVAPMIKRVRAKLGLDVPREEPKQQSEPAQNADVSIRTQPAKFAMPAVKVEVTANVTQNFPAGKDVDDRYIRSPFNPKRNNNKNTLKTQQQEEDERAKAVVPASMEQSTDFVRVAESKQEEIPREEELEDFRVKTFVESVPDGELLILMSENGHKAYYRRSGDDLVGKNNSIVKTESAWKRHQNGWKLVDIGAGSISEKIPAKQDTETPSLGDHTDDTDTEEDYVSGKVFAKQYLELHPPLEEASERPDDVVKEREMIDEKISEQQEGESVLSDREGGQRNIDDLRIFVREFRAAWVKEDAETTTAWKKIRSMFGIEKDKKKGENQVLYENALQNLREAEIETLQNDASLTREQQSRRAEQLLRYYKIDESKNLIDERVRYKSEHFSDASAFEKMTVLFGNMGRAYNRIPLKGKLAITAAFLGITTATVLSGGGGTALGAMAFVSVIRKIASGAGTTVGVEALLESFGERSKTTQSEEEIQEQLKIFGKENLSAKPEVNIDVLNAFLKKDIASLNGKLQNEKRVKTWRKLGAVGVGGLVGSGWLTQVAMDHLGGNEAVDWTKNHIVNAFYGSEVLPANISAKPIIPAEAQPVVKPDMISGMFDKDYVVQKGDSVWKIAGRLADTMKLDEPEKTHFIDALKDQYGDVQLKAGETINFSSHGIDEKFIADVLAQTKALSSDQLSSIVSNDAKIAEYVTNHPKTMLTNARVDEILGSGSPHQSDVIKMTDGNTLLAGGIDGSNPDIAIQETRNVLVQENIAFTDPKAYLTEHPEDFGRFNTTLGRIRMNIFMMNPGEASVPIEYDYTMNGQKLGATKMSDVLKDVNGFENEKLGYRYDRIQNPLHYDQMKELVRFTEASEKAFGVKFSQVEAGENIDHYTRRMTTVALRTGKEIKGFFKP